MKNRKNNFDAQDLLETMADIKEMSGKEVKKFYKRLFKDESYLGWLFNPNLDDRAKIKKQQETLYEVFTKPKSIKGIIAAFDSVNPSDYSRAAAANIYAIANLGKSVAVERINDINDARKAGDIKDSKAKEEKQKAEKYLDLTEELQEVVKEIVKKDGKKLAKQSKLPKKICIMALHSVPNPEYIDRYKIGHYLNNLLTLIYNHVEESDNYSDYFNGDNVEYKWDEFFKTVFGKQNDVEVATFVLLEGVHRIKDYKNAAVRDCWDSLTKWALKTLEKAPEQIKTQMIELYIKRIDRMFSNGVFDLRADILKLSSDLFPSLTKVISRYSDKIEAIMKK